MFIFAQRMVCFCHASSQRRWTALQNRNQTPVTLTAVAFVAAYLYGLMRAFVSHPRWGLYVYIGTFYLHPPMRWWGASLPDLRWSLIAAVVTLIALQSAKVERSASPWTSHTFAKCLIAFVLWQWVQLGWANPRHFDNGVVLWTKYVILSYIVYRLVRDKQTLLGFAYAHILGCLYFGMLALSADGGGRLENVGGPGVADSNTLGMHMTTGLLFAGALILTQTGWRRWSVIAIVPFIANCIVQTQSRGAFLGGASGGLVYFYLAPKQHRKYFAILGVMGICVLLAYAPAGYWDRMYSLNKMAENTENMDSSAESRLVIAKKQLEMFAAHPLGLGFDTTNFLSTSYLEGRWLSESGGRSSHNTLLAVLTDQGLPGITIALVMIFSMVRLALHLRRAISDIHDPFLMSMLAAICGSLAVSFTAGIFTDYLKAEVQIWSLSLMLSLLQIVQNEQSTATIGHKQDGHRH